MRRGLRPAARDGGGVGRWSFFFTHPLGILILTVVKALALLVPLLVGVAYLTYAERKVLAAMQLRKGPNVVGPFGLFQPFADAIKMLMKETIVPTGANRVLFLLAPMLDLHAGDAGLGGDPGERWLGDRRHQRGYPVPVRDRSLGVYGVIIAGWASSPRKAYFDSTPSPR